jgi:periplasmic protein TonB
MVEPLFAHSITHHDAPRQWSAAGVSVLLHGLAAMAFMGVMRETPPTFLPPASKPMVEVMLVSPSMLKAMQPKPVESKREQAKPVAKSQPVKPKAIHQIQLQTVAKPKAMPAKAMAQRQAVSSPVPVETRATTDAASESKASPASAMTSHTVSDPVFDADYLRNPAPEYPTSAKRRGLQGSVMLEVVVSPAGAARNVAVARSSGVAALDSAAREAVQRWRFIPAKRGEEVVEARVMVPVEFRLQ